MLKVLVRVRCLQRAGSSRLGLLLMSLTGLRILRISGLLWSLRSRKIRRVGMLSRRSGYTVIARTRSLRGHNRIDLVRKRLLGGLRARILKLLLMMLLLQLRGMLLLKRLMRELRILVGEVTIGLSREHLGRIEGLRIKRRRRRVQAGIVTWPCVHRSSITRC